MATGPAPPPLGPTDPSVERYALGVAITVVAILSQYVLPSAWPPSRVVYDNLAGDLFVVYGVPVISFAVLVGAGPLRGWARRMGTAVFQGLRWYGGLSALALAITLALALVYEAVDPSALQLLNRPNPVVVAAAGNPWFWIGFSFVIGAFEETIFRGWIYGFWEGRRVGWVAPAVGSSLVFAGLHLYYGTTYGAAAPLIFPSLFLLGLAFAATYHATGGNLVVIAVLHGAYDAAAFYYVFVNPSIGLLFRYLPVLAGVILALLYATESREPPSAIPFAGFPAAAQSPGERISSTQRPSGPS